MNIRQERFGIRSRTLQAGATAIEMAFVFPLLFAVTYATVVYGYVYYIQQSLNNIAEEAVRSVVRVDPAIGTAGNYSGALDSAAETSIQASLDRTPIIGRDAIVRSKTLNPAAVGGPNYTVMLTLPLSALTSSGFASISLPGGLGSFPPLPVNLTASAVAQVN